MSYTSFEMYADWQGNEWLRYGHYEDVQVWAAAQMVENCPTLSQGWWWNASRDRVYRREWWRSERPTNDVSLKDTIDLGKGSMFGFSYEFTQNSDGLASPPDPNWESFSDLEL